MMSGAEHLGPRSNTHHTAGQPPRLATLAAGPLRHLISAPTRRLTHRVDHEWTTQTRTAMTTFAGPSRSEVLRSRPVVGSWRRRRRNRPAVPIELPFRF